MKNLTKDKFEEFEFIPKLLKYFALSSENKVTVPGVFDGTLLTYYQDDEGLFHKVVDIKKLGDPTESFTTMTLENLINIVRWLPELPSTMKDFGFKNMKEQVLFMSTAYIALG